MPNDPRVKFKKRMYDPSRNLIYEERTGGGGGSFPSGGGGGGGGGNIPWTPIGPSNPVNPVNPYPYLPSFPIIPTAPFDPYQRGPKARAEAAEARIILEENARLRARPNMRSLDMQDMRGRDREPSVLDNIDLLVDEPSGVPKFVIKPQDLLNPNRPPRIPRILDPKDIVPNALGTPQEQMAAYAEGQAIRDELLGPASTVDEVEALGKTTLAKRNAKMRADGKSQEYIDSVNKIINDHITAKKLRLETDTLPLEDQLKYAINDIIDPRTPLDEIPAHKLNIDELRYELQRRLEVKNIQAMDEKAANPTAANKAKVTKLKKELNRMIERNIDYERPEMEALREYQKTLPAERTRVDPLDAEEAEMRSLQERLDELRDTPTRPREDSLTTRPREGSLTTQTLEDSLALDKTFEEYQARQAARLEELQTNARRGGPRPATEATEAEAAGIGGGPPRARPAEPAPAPEPAPARPVAPETIEIGSLDARNHITTFDEYYEGIVGDNLFEHGFKMPDIPESIRVKGELAIKKYIAEKAIKFMHEPGKPGLRKREIVRGERTETETIITQERAQRHLEKLYDKAEAQQASSSRPAPRPPAESPGPSPTPSPPERSVEMQSSSQRRGLMDTLTDRLSGSRAYQPMDTDILDTIDEMQGNVERGGRVETSDIDLQDLGGNVERGGRLPTADNSPASSGTTTPESTEAQEPVDTAPARPVDTAQTRPARPASGLEPMELETVPLGGSARPSARGRGRGRAPTSASGAKAPVAPKPTLKFGRGTDVNIQGGRNNLVASEFMNSAAGRASTSLRGLASRAPTLRAPSINTIKRVGIEGGKMGAGIAVGIGVSYLMAQYFKAHPATDRFSQIGQQYAIGFSGAAAGNIVMRALAIAGRMGAKKVMTTTGMKILVVESAYATRDAAAFVAVQLGVEIATEALMDRYKFNHTTSKTVAAAAGTVVGIVAGMKEGGPFGAVLMAGFGAVSITEAFFEGQEEDREEAENRRIAADQANKVNSARLVLVRNLKLVDNDYDRAFAMLSPTQKKNINSVGTEASTTFRNSLGVEFNPLEKERNGNPYAPKDPEESPMEKGIFQAVDMLALSGNPAFALLSLQEHSFQAQQAKEQEAKNKYYEAYVNWYINKKKEVNPSPPPPEDEGFRLLERDTLGSWRTSAEFSGELVYEQTQNYNRVINAARTQILDEWRNNMTLIEDIQHRDQAGRDLVDTAGLDVDFFKDYQTWVIQDATTQLATQFNHFGINYRDADQRLVDIAGRDPSVLPALDHYYEVMTKLSAETGLPVAELARLDALPVDQQERELGKVNALRERVIREGLINDRALVDEFNAGIIRDMQSYGDNFEAIMTNINQQQMLMGYSYLYGTNRTDFYRQLHLEAPVIEIPPNPYAGGVEFDYNKNRTPNDTLIYGYRYNLTDEQNQELEDYLYEKNRDLYQKGDTKGRLTTADAMAKAAAIYDRDIEIYRKSDEEVAKENNMTLTEYYAEYGYDKGKIAPPEPIEWQDITERPPPLPPSIFASDESDDGAAERQANANLQAQRIAGGGTADEFDRMAAGAYDASQRALVDAQGGNNIAGDQPQPRTDTAGQIIREENDPDGP
jgi:hypothetical protein